MALCAALYVALEGIAIGRRQGSYSIRMTPKLQALSHRSRHMFFKDYDRKANQNALSFAIRQRG